MSTAVAVERSIIPPNSSPIIMLLTKSIDIDELHFKFFSFSKNRRFGLIEDNESNTLTSSQYQRLSDTRKDVEMNTITTTINSPQESFCNSVELVLHMMSFLGAFELTRISQVCRQWKELSKDHLLWRNLIVLSHFPVETKQIQYPKWSSSWQDVWKWYCLCRTNIFNETQEKNGLGTFTWTSNGSKYEGEWKDNKENGRGTKYWPDGATFEGEWKESKFNGFGKHTWASGSSYEGHWLNHKRNGFGKNTWVQKDSYEGEWLDDQKDGRGIYIWSDGRRYEGTWSNDKRSGIGIFTWPKLGCKYEGSWKDDNRHGFGKFTWKDGDSYEGEWVLGKRYGRGQLTTKSGKVFDQEWREVDEFDASNKGDIQTHIMEVESNNNNGVYGQGYSAPKRRLSSEDDIIPSFEDSSSTKRQRSH